MGEKKEILYFFERSKVSVSSSRTLSQGSVNFFCKGPHSKCFRLCGQNDLCPNHSILPSYDKSVHREYINEWICLCSNKPIFTIIGSEANLAARQQIPFLHFHQNFSFIAAVRAAWVKYLCAGLLHWSEL